MQQDMSKYLLWLLLNFEFPNKEIRKKEKKNYRKIILGQIMSYTYSIFLTS